MPLAKFRILRPLRLAILALTTLLAGACAPEKPAAPALQLLDLRPRQRVGVYLNEPLVLHFSSDLDRASITARSVRITSATGLVASGTRFVVGRELTFLPDPVRAADLLDGGYRPDTTYVIELLGFPGADAIRSKDGACLPSTLHIEFHTVAVDIQGSGYVFLDDSPDGALPLLIPADKLSSTQPPRTRMTSQTGLELEGEEPLDPSTVSDDVFSLVRDDGNPPYTEYRLRAVLVDNHNKHAYFGKGKTTLRLLPEALVPPGSYRLSIDPTNLRIRDFGRHLVPVIGTKVLQQLRIKVQAPSEAEIGGEYLEDFLDTSMRSGALVPGSDGTALWSNSGRLELRFPAAAGDGSDGDVNLSARADTRRIQAARLSLPEEVVCQLDAGGGLCRLSSQGALELAGKLRRVGGSQRAEFPAIVPGDTLSNWLERQDDSGLPLTVLIAGGDLRISGELEVPGPLLLVAGGRVLVSGRITVAGTESIGASFFGGHGEGGAIALWARAGPERLPQIADAWLVLDPPRQNPLVRPLTYAVRSKPIPEKGRARRWLSAEPPKGRAGAGSLKVLYVGERRSPGASGDFEVQVDDPALLVDCPTLRLVLELQMPADLGKAWDPPMLDMTRVRWESEP